MRDSLPLVRDEGNRASAERFFDRHYNITAVDLERYLAAALSAGGDFADLYLEHSVTSSISVEESTVKSATELVSLGCGVRVVSGERTGYGYTEDLLPERILKIGTLAGRVACGPARVRRVRLSSADLPCNLYPVASPAGGDFTQKLELLRRADYAARAYDSRIKQVQVSYGDQIRHVLVATSDGCLAADIRPFIRIGVSTVAEVNGNRQGGFSGRGGRGGLQFFDGENSAEQFGREAARRAILQLEAREAPAGEMEVVLGPGWSGVLLHEAVGHCLEADFNRRGVSPFSGRLGQVVASELCTVVDDGSVPGRCGSLNVDDEGTPGKQNVLIHRGKLESYLHDRLSAHAMHVERTGNGRRESYEHIPIPRMTNTYLLPGKDDPVEIVRSVRSGLYAVDFFGGQVEITSGKFVFCASEAYLIENGKISAPVKGVTLVGDGPTVLRSVKAVGNDLKLDPGLATCAKEGQSVPVSFGLPTVKIDSLTVGGTTARTLQ